MADTLRHKRRDHEAPAAVAERGWRYHHLGIPCADPRPGERYLAHLKVYVSGFDSTPMASNGCGSMRIAQCRTWSRPFHTWRLK